MAGGIMCLQYERELLSHSSCRLRCRAGRGKISTQQFKSSKNSSRSREKCIHEIGRDNQINGAFQQTFYMQLLIWQ